MVIVPFPQNLSIIVLTKKRAHAVAKLRHFDGINVPDRRSDAVAGTVLLGTYVEVTGTQCTIRTSLVKLRYSPLCRAIS